MQAVNMARRLIFAFAMASLAAYSAPMATAQDTLPDEINEFLLNEETQAAAPQRWCLGVTPVNFPLGAQIRSVQSGSAAAAAGIRPGDWVIVAHYRKNGQPVTRVIGTAAGHWTLQHAVADNQGPPVPPRMTLLTARQGVLRPVTVILRPCGPRGNQLQEEAPQAEATEAVEEGT